MLIDSSPASRSDAYDFFWGKTVGAAKDPPSLEHERYCDEVGLNFSLPTSMQHTILVVPFIHE